MAEMELVSSRKKQRWVLIAFFFFSGIIAATWSSRIPDIQHKLGLNNAALGTVLFAMPLGLMSGLLLASWLVASFGPKRMMGISCSLCALFLFLAGTATSNIGLMVALFFLGASRTFLNLSANTGALEVQKLYERPIIASFHGVWSLACFAAAGISTMVIILDITPFYHFLGIALVVIPGVFALSGRSPVSDDIDRKPFFVMPDKFLLLLGLMAACSMLCEGAMFDWSVNYFEKAVKAERSFVTSGYIAFIVAMAAGRLMGDRFIHLFGPYRMIVFNAALMAIGFALAAVFPFLLPATIGFLIIGIGDSTLVPIIYMLAANAKKVPPGYALSSVTFIGYTGFLVGPVLIGNLSERWGMSFAFYMLSGISLLIVVLSKMVKQSSSTNS